MRHPKLNSPTLKNICANLCLQSCHEKNREATQAYATKPQYSIFSRIFHADTYTSEAQSPRTPPYSMPISMTRSQQNSAQFNLLTHGRSRKTQILSNFNHHIFTPRSHTILCFIVRKWGGQITNSQGDKLLTLAKGKVDKSPILGYTCMYIYMYICNQLRQNYLNNYFQAELSKELP